MSDDDEAAALAHQQELDQQEQQMTLHAKLAAIQQKLNAPKSQLNKFGGYNYRSCEDILTAVKPLLGDLTVVISDDMVMLGDRFYVKATAAITDGNMRIESTAYAREALAKKGMDDSQITGSTSSYARKYALNGLLLIDDAKDADSQDNREPTKAEINKQAQDDLQEADSHMQAADSLEALQAAFAGWYKFFAGDAGAQAKVKAGYDKRKQQFEKTKEAA